MNETDVSRQRKSCGTFCAFNSAVLQSIAVAPDLFLGLWTMKFIPDSSHLQASDSSGQGLKLGIVRLGRAAGKVRPNL